MLLLEKDIPEYLCSSSFLQGMLGEGPFPESGIEIPDGCLKMDMGICTRSDLTDLLRTLRFWLLPELINDNTDLLKAALKPPNKFSFLEDTAEFRTCFPIVDELCSIIRSEGEQTLACAAFYGRMQVIKFMVEELHCPITACAGGIAASQGHLECLEYFRSQGMKLSMEVCIGAAFSSKLTIVQYMIEHQAEGLDSIAGACAAKGNFECLKYVIVEVHNSDRSNIALAFQAAAKCGCVKVLALMRVEWGQDPEDDFFDEVMVCAAARDGHLLVLQFAREKNVSMAIFQRALPPAARAKDPHCVQYLHELGCTLTEEAAENAAAEGHLCVLQYLFQHHCPANTHVSEILARNGFLDCLKCAHEHGCPWDKWTCNAAARRGHVECLKYAREQGCPWTVHPSYSLRRRSASNWVNDPTLDVDDDISVCAASVPSTACLLYIERHGARLHPKCGKIALLGSSVEMLQFLHARGFTWDADDCVTAASTGSVECLRFLHEIGTPWDARTCAIAAFNQLPCLQYAHENGCPWDESTTLNARNDKPCYEYAVAHGCPLPTNSKRKRK